MNTGVYAIRNVVNNKRYVGSTGKLNVRWIQHKYELNRQHHFNPYLQNAWNKYGGKCFVYDIVEKCDGNILLDREEFWIKNLHSFKDDNGYNLCKTPRASRLGCKASPETIAKMKSSLSKENHPMWGKHLKKSTKEKLSKLTTRISKPNSGHKKKYKVVNPNGDEVEIVGLRKFCRENGLPVSIMWRIVNGKKREYNGWKQQTSNASS
jgi:group I intron endonuclease